MSISSLKALAEGDLKGKALELFQEIQNETFIKIEKTDPDSEKIFTLFKQLLHTEEGIKLISKIQEASAGEPPLLIKIGAVNQCFQQLREITMKFYNEYVVVMDITDIRETKIELMPDIVALFHELVHDLDFTLKKKKPTTDYRQEYPSDYNNYTEYVAITKGVEGISENSFRANLNLPPRVNHYYTLFTPHHPDELMKQDDNYKIQALENYVCCNATRNAQQIMLLLRPEQIAKSNALKFAVELCHYFICSKILEAGKGSWSADSLQEVLKTVVEKGEKEICQQILEAGKELWSADTLALVLQSAVVKGEKEICQQLLEAGKGLWSADSVQEVLKVAAKKKNRNIYQQIIDLVFDN